MKMSFYLFLIFIALFVVGCGGAAGYCSNGNNTYSASSKSCPTGYVFTEKYEDSLPVMCQGAAGKTCFACPIGYSGVSYPGNSSHVCIAPK